MRILVACEFSGVVRDAFIAKGHDAVSCDLLPTERPGPHIQGDVLPLLKEPWDMMLCFPPCTHLCASGAKWFKAKREDGRQQQGIDFFLAFTRTVIPRVCIENPIGIMSTHYRKPEQIVQPWQFGHGETKATCLWLYGLPRLQPTCVVEGREPRIHRMGPGPTRSMDRSKTYTGIAEAMAEQWDAAEDLPL